MWLIDELKSEWEFMKKLATKVKRIRKIKERKIMNDSDFQAGMTAAVVAAAQSFIASSGYAATGFSGSYTYTPPVTSIPPAETVPFSF